MDIVTVAEEDLLNEILPSWATKIVVDWIDGIKMTPLLTSLPRAHILYDSSPYLWNYVYMGHIREEIYIQSNPLVIVLFPCYGT